MSDGNTLIRNAMAGPGLDQANPSAAGEDDTYIAVEEACLEQAEEQLMDGEVTSEDSEGDKVERQMLTAALVNSVVESSSKNPPVKNEGGEQTEDDSKKRYSLRKRRRPSGEPSSAPGSPVKTKQAISSAPSPPATKPPDVKVAAAKPPVAKPLIKAATSVAPAQAKHVPAKPQSPASKKAMSPRARVKTEAVPAVTVASPATLLPVPLPLSASTFPLSSSLPPALQPPLRPKPILPPKATAASGSRIPRPKPTAKSQQKRLAPAVRLPVPSKPLIPTPGVAVVPNPLSNPLPVSKSILVSKQKKLAPGAPSAAQATLKTGTKLTVPCPLLPSTFDRSHRGQHYTNEAMPPPPCSSAPALVEKKKVTIAPEPVGSRGRIFSIDLDPASLDFSVLESGESGTPAPASADLPLVTSGSRDRAFSFECFAFGISADEALPPLSEQSTEAGGQARQQEMLVLPRPRGDSIIFDPVSFQEGGIHEEHALTTRETRGLSIDLDAVLMSSSAPGPPPSDRDVLRPLGVPSSTIKYAPVSSSVGGRPTPAGTRPGLPKPHYRAPIHHYPDMAHSNVRVGVPHHPHHPHYAKPPRGHHHHPHMAPSNPIPQEMTANGAVAIIGSCATSTTLQMELLNKDGRIGIYLPEARRERIARFHAKRKMRIWRKRIKYDCRKKLADSRPRIKGRFVKRVDVD